VGADRHASLGGRFKRVARRPRKGADQSRPSQRNRLPWPGDRKCRHERPISRPTSLGSGASPGSSPGRTKSAGTCGIAQRRNRFLPSARSGTPRPCRARRSARAGAGGTGFGPPAGLRIKHESLPLVAARSAAAAANHPGTPCSGTEKQPSEVPAGAAEHQEESQDAQTRKLGGNPQNYQSETYRCQDAGGPEKPQPGGRSRSQFPGQTRILSSPIHFKFLEGACAHCPTAALQHFLPVWAYGHRISKPAGTLACFHCRLGTRSIPARPRSGLSHWNSQRGLPRTTTCSGFSARSLPCSADGFSTLSEQPQRPLHGLASRLPRGMSLQQPIETPRGAGVAGRLARC
jgi:hypothetical protein